MPKSVVKIVFTVLFIAFFSFNTSARTYVFTGGAPGGSFTHYSSTIVSFLNISNIKISSEDSNGSLENIRLVNSGRADFGIAYKSDVYFASKGELLGDTKEYDKIKIIGCLYNAPAQLVVNATSDINSVYDLKGKNIAFGSAGSGSAEIAERFFKHLNIWEHTNPWHLSFKSSAAAFINNQLDGFWVISSYPNNSITETTSRKKLKLISTWDYAVANGFIEKYPLFTKVSIPANTYRFQTEDIETFQDNAVLIVNKNIPDDFVYEITKAIFNPINQNRLKEIHPNPNNINYKNNRECASFKMHPGAVRYWEEKFINLD